LALFFPTSVPACTANNGQNVKYDRFSPLAKQCFDIGADQAAADQTACDQLPDPNSVDVLFSCTSSCSKCDEPSCPAATLQYNSLTKNLSPGPDYTCDAPPAGCACTTPEWRCADASSVFAPANCLMTASNFALFAPVTPTTSCADTGPIDYTPKVAPECHATLNGNDIILVGGECGSEPTSTAEFACAPSTCSTTVCDAHVCSGSITPSGGSPVDISADITTCDAPVSGCACTAPEWRCGDGTAPSTVADCTFSVARYTAGVFTAPTDEIESCTSTPTPVTFTPAAVECYHQLSNGSFIQGTNDDCATAGAMPGDVDINLSCTPTCLDCGLADCNAVLGSEVFPNADCSKAEACTCTSTAEWQCADSVGTFSASNCQFSVANKGSFTQSGSIDVCPTLPTDITFTQLDVKCFQQLDSGEWIRPSNTTPCNTKPAPVTLSLACSPACDTCNTPADCNGTIGSESLPSIDCSATDCSCSTPPTWTCADKNGNYSAANCAFSVANIDSFTSSAPIDTCPTVAEDVTFTHKGIKCQQAFANAPTIDLNDADCQAAQPKPTPVVVSFSCAPTCSACRATPKCGATLGSESFPTPTCANLETCSCSNAEWRCKNGSGDVSVENCDFSIANFDSGAFTVDPADIAACPASPQAVDFTVLEAQCYEQYDSNQNWIASADSNCLTKPTVVSVEFDCTPACPGGCNAPSSCASTLNGAAMTTQATCTIDCTCATPEWRCDDGNGSYDVASCTLDAVSYPVFNNVNAVDMTTCPDTPTDVTFRPTALCYVQLTPGAAATQGVEDDCINSGSPVIEIVATFSCQNSVCSADVCDEYICSGSLETAPGTNFDISADITTCNAPTDGCECNPQWQCNDGSDTFSTAACLWSVANFENGAFTGDVSECPSTPTDVTFSQDIKCYEQLTPGAYTEAVNPTVCDSLTPLTPVTKTFSCSPTCTMCDDPAPSCNPTLGGEAVNDQSITCADELCDCTPEWRCAADSTGTTFTAAACQKPTDAATFWTFTPALNALDCDESTPTTTATPIVKCFALNSPSDADLSEQDDEDLCAQIVSTKPAPVEMNLACAPTCSKTVCNQNDSCNASVSYMDGTAVEFDVNGPSCTFDCDDTCVTTCYKPGTGQTEEATCSDVSYTRCVDPQDDIPANDKIFITDLYDVVCTLDGVKVDCLPEVTEQNWPNCSVKCSDPSDLDDYYACDNFTGRPVANLCTTWTPLNTERVKQCWTVDDVKIVCPTGQDVHKEYQPGQCSVGCYSKTTYPTVPSSFTEDDEDFLVDCIPNAFRTLAQNTCSTQVDSSTTRQVTCLFKNDDVYLPVATSAGTCAGVASIEAERWGPADCSPVCSPIDSTLTPGDVTELDTCTNDTLKPANYSGCDDLSPDDYRNVYDTFTVGEDKIVAQGTIGSDLALDLDTIWTSQCAFTQLCSRGVIGPVVCSSPVLEPKVCTVLNEAFPIPSADYKCYKTVNWYGTSITPIDAATGDCALETPMPNTYNCSPADEIDYCKQTDNSFIACTEADWSTADTCGESETRITARKAKAGNFILSTENDKFVGVVFAAAERIPGAVATLCKPVPVCGSESVLCSDNDGLGGFPAYTEDICGQEQTRTAVCLYGGDDKATVEALVANLNIVLQAEYQAILSVDCAANIPLTHTYPCPSGLFCRLSSASEVEIDDLTRAQVGDCSAATGIVPCRDSCTAFDRDVEDGMVCLLDTGKFSIDYTKCPGTKPTCAAKYACQISSFCEAYGTTPTLTSDICTDSNKFGTGGCFTFGTDFAAATCTDVATTTYYQRRAVQVFTYYISGSDRVALPDNVLNKPTAVPDSDKKSPCTDLTGCAPAINSALTIAPVADDSTFTGQYRERGSATVSWTSFKGPVDTKAKVQVQYGLVSSGTTVAAWVDIVQADLTAKTVEIVLPRIATATQSFNLIIRAHVVGNDAVDVRAAAISVNKFAICSDLSCASKTPGYFTCDDTQVDSSDLAKPAVCVCNPAYAGEGSSWLSTSTCLQTDTCQNLSSECSNSGFYNPDSSTTTRCSTKCTCPGGQDGDKCQGTCPATSCIANQGIPSTTASNCHCSSCYNGFAGVSCNLCTRSAIVEFSSLSAQIKAIFGNSADKTNWLNSFKTTLLGLMEAPSSALAMNDKKSLISGDKLSVVLELVGQCNSSSMLLLALSQDPTVSEVVTAWNDAINPTALGQSSTVQAATTAAVVVGTPVDVNSCLKSNNCPAYVGGCDVDPDHPACKVDPVEDKKSNSTTVIIAIVVPVVIVIVIAIAVVLIFCFGCKADGSGSDSGAVKETHSLTGSTKKAKKPSRHAADTDHLELV